MKNLFKLKRFSYKLVSKGFYIVFFIVGFFCGLFFRNANILEYLKELIRGVLL